MPVIAAAGMAAPAFADGYSGPVCPSGTAAITKGSSTVSDGTATATVTSLRGNTQSGDSVTVTFTVAPGCKNLQVTLVSYRAPGPTFDPNTANQQTVFASDTATFNAGTGTLEVTIPAGYYQVDFVLGAVITQLGPAGSSNFYSAQNRLIDHDNGGSLPSNALPATSLAPACNLTAILPGPPAQLEVTVGDTGFGLQSIQVTELINATVVVPSFTVGTAQSILVVATKVDQTQTGYLGLQVTNTGGYVANCDPAF